MFVIHVFIIVPWNSEMLRMKMSFCDVWIHPGLFCPHVPDFVCCNPYCNYYSWFGFLSILQTCKVMLYPRAFAQAVPSAWNTLSLNNYTSFFHLKSLLKCHFFTDIEESCTSSICPFFFFIYHCLTYLHSVVLLRSTEWEDVETRTFTASPCCSHSIQAVCWKKDWVDILGLMCHIVDQDILNGVTVFSACWWKLNVI